MERVERLFDEVGVNKKILKEKVFTKKDLANLMNGMGDVERIHNNEYFITAEQYENIKKSIPNTGVQVTPVISGISLKILH